MTLEEIEKQYEEYKPGLDDECENITQLYAKIAGDISLLEDDRVELLEIIKENYKFKFIDTIKNFLAIFGEYNLEFYDEDNAILDKYINLAILYGEYLNKLIGVLDEDNFLEIHKLVCFIEEYYSSNSDYLDMRRNVIEAENRGYYYYDPSYDDTSSEFNEFFNKEWDKISGKKTVEKTKKM